MCNGYVKTPSYEHFPYFAGVWQGFGNGYIKASLVCVCGGRVKEGNRERERTVTAR